MMKRYTADQRVKLVRRVQQKMKLGGKPVLQAIREVGIGVSSYYAWKLAAKKARFGDMPPGRYVKAKAAILKPAGQTAREITASEKAHQRALDKQHLFGTRYNAFPPALSAVTAHNVWLAEENAQLWKVVQGLIRSGALARALGL